MPIAYILSDKVKTLLEFADGLLSKMLERTGWSGLDGVDWMPLTLLCHIYLSTYGAKKR